MALESIAVVGGGIGGLASAILLSRIGCRVTVFEQAGKPGPVGAGFLLQPPGQEVLDRLGVLDEVCQYAVPISGLRSRTASGRTLLDLKYQDLNGPARQGLGVQRSTIYEALFNQASRASSISFRWGHPVERLLNQGDKVCVHTSNESESFDLCLLAAGSNSQLADGLFDGRVKRPYRWGCLWTTIQLPKGFSPDVLEQRCYRAQQMMGVLPVCVKSDGYEAALYWSGRLEDLRQLNNDNFDRVRAQMNSIWPETAEAIEHLTYSDFVVASYNDIWTPAPYNKRIVALGDVSHATSPQLGQGCTMALLDAESLTEKLGNYHFGHTDLEEALSAWWAQRKNQVQYVRHLSRLLTPLYQSDLLAFSLFRDWVMAPMGRLPALYQLQIKTLASEILLKRQAHPVQMAH